MVSQLIAREADLHIRDKDGTALIMASHNGHSGIVKLLLEHGVSVN